MGLHRAMAGRRSNVPAHVLFPYVRSVPVQLRVGLHINGQVRKIAVFFSSKYFNKNTFGKSRFFAVTQPMKLAGIDRRGRVMLITAWSASFVFSVPQSIIFHVENHPKVADYTQCVTYNFFANATQEIAYAMTCMVLLYALPLIIIIFCYASIYRVLLHNSRKCLSGLGNFGKPIFSMSKEEKLKHFIICS